VGPAGTDSHPPPGPRAGRFPLLLRHGLQQECDGGVRRAGNDRGGLRLLAYGQAASTGDLVQPVQWSGEMHDEEPALVYYNYRYYNPKDGRWINRDPIAEQGGWNLYGFVGNSTQDQVDALGLIGDKCSPGKCFYNDYDIKYINLLDNNILNPDDIDNIEKAVIIINYLSHFEGAGKYKIPRSIRISNNSRMDGDALIKKAKELAEKRARQGFVVAKIKISVKKCVCKKYLIIGRKFAWKIIESDWETHGNGKNWTLENAKKEAILIVAKMMKKICRDQTNTVKDIL